MNNDLRRTKQQSGRTDYMFHSEPPRSTLPYHRTAGDGPSDAILKLPHATLVS